MGDARDPRSDSREREPSAQSLRALDGLNFFLADVRDGMGPFLGIGYGAMFFLVAFMAAASAAAVLLIREPDINHELARGAADGEEDGRDVVGTGELFQDRRILTFIVSAWVERRG